MARMQHNGQDFPFALSRTHLAAALSLSLSLGYLSPTFAISQRRNPPKARHETLLALLRERPIFL
jgi:hypothetical protein